MSVIATSQSATAGQSRSGLLGTETLLRAGIVAGPLYFLVAGILAVTRDGFDLTRHPLSLLSNGPFGWVQIANFVIAGVLFGASAIGIRRVLHPGRGSTWAPILVAVFAAGLIAGGVFVADPVDGFPPGSTAPSEQSWHSLLHGVAPIVGFLALVAATIVMARRFAADGRRGWMVYSIAAGTAAFILSSLAAAPGGSAFLALGGLIGWTWLSAVSAHLLRTNSNDSEEK